MTLVIDPIILSPPIGTHLHFDWATSVHGTFTAHPRPGSRILQALKTIRPVRGGWVNRIGLINTGIREANLEDPVNIYSVAAIDDHEEWDIILEAIRGNRILELNLGCPNAPQVLPSVLTLRKFRLKCQIVIIKLPPHWRTAMQIVHAALQAGITHFHACNTIPTERGGKSGDDLRTISLNIGMRLKEKHPGITLIGGGGIYLPEHVEHYRAIGAEHFSLSTAFFAPWKIPALKRVIYEI